ncbi:serine proteinase stubble [Chrysoperla carnea]|uniref:serine proteinase stubble n=1 Tax=Chrysoperla carnea TaxID=189513 RepID=UPI001D06A774|nr:serine proteinase stubble [Chrysoperla carnea]
MKLSNLSSIVFITGLFLTQAIDSPYFNRYVRLPVYHRKNSLINTPIGALSSSKANLYYNIRHDLLPKAQSGVVNIHAEKQAQVQAKNLSQILSVQRTGEISSKDLLKKSLTINNDTPPRWSEFYSEEEHLRTSSPPRQLYYNNRQPVTYQQNYHNRSPKSLTFPTATGGNHDFININTEAGSFQIKPEQLFVEQSQRNQLDQQITAAASSNYNFNTSSEIVQNENSDYWSQPVLNHFENQADNSNTRGTEDNAASVDTSNSRRYPYIGTNAPSHIHKHTPRNPLPPQPYINVPPPGSPNYFAGGNNPASPGVIASASSTTVPRTVGNSWRSRGPRVIFPTNSIGGVGGTPNANNEFVTFRDQPDDITTNDWLTGDANLQDLNAGPPPPPPTGISQPEQTANDRGCGISPAKQTAQRRIVGGDEAGFGSFPWQAYIRIGTSRCGGSLVSRRHVVTAGHCVARASPRQVHVTLGDYVINSAVEPLPAYTFGVSSIQVHPYFKFTPQADRYDVAVLRLDRPAHSLPHIAPICLPTSGEDFLGQVGVAAGWGALSPGSRLRPQTLQSVPVPVLDNRVCERWHRANGINVVIYDEMLCAGYKHGGRDSCQGDSGGPLMLQRAGRWYLIGIVSAGYSCAQPGQPGIYHRIAHTVHWLARMIGI